MDTAVEQDLRDATSRAIDVDERRRNGDLVHRQKMYQSLPSPTFGHIITQLSLDEQATLRRLFGEWLLLNDEDLEAFRAMLLEVFHSFNLRKKAVRERVESREYVRLVKRAIARYSIIDSEIKRHLVKNVLANAAVLTLSPDALLERFIDWIEDFGEDYFRVIKTVDDNPGITRKKIWLTLNNELPSEDSAAADTYRLLIHDLSTNQIIRQPRKKDYQGMFLKKSPSNKKAATTSLGVLTSAFDDQKAYALTELGKQMVRYLLHERGLKQTD